MPLIEYIYTSTKNIEWCWPLRIALHTHDVDLFKSLDEHAQYGKFTLMHPVAKVLSRNRREKIIGTNARGKYDLLLVVDDGKSNLASFRSIRANYVLICQLRPADEAYSDYSKRHGNLIREIMSHFSATGLVFFALDQKPGFVVNWFAAFMKSLTNNETILTAIRQNIKNGHITYASNSALDTPLEKGFAGTVQRFKKLYDDIYPNLPNRKQFRPLRQQLDTLKKLTNLPSGVPSSFPDQLAKNSLQLFEGVIDLNEQVKTQGVQMRPIATRLAKQETAIRKKADEAIISPAKDDPKPVKIFRETLKFNKEPVNAITASADYVKEVEERLPKTLTEQDARYLQASINDANQPGVLLKERLEPATRYNLTVEIGRLKKTSLQNDTPFPADDIFIATRTPEEPITIIFQPIDGSIPQTRTLLLPKIQDSLSVNFDFTTPTEKGTFSAAILASHKNRLIQILQLNAPISSSSDPMGSTGINLKTIFSARRNLSGLSERQDFDLSLHYQEQDGESVLTGVFEKKPIRFNTGGGLTAIINRIKIIIETAARQPEEHPADLYHKNNQKLLLKLAVAGSQLYTNMIRGLVSGEGPLQIVANRAVFAPFDFVYDLPAPLFNAKLCDHAAKALQAGSCLNCFNKTISPSQHVCPFGFWGFNRVIERFKYDDNENLIDAADLLVYEEPGTGRDTLTILQSTIHGSSQRVDVCEPKLRQKIADFLHTKSSTSSVDNWLDWVEQTKTCLPETIILITHVQRNDEFGSDEMEIGNDVLAQVHFGEHHLLRSRKPFAIVIGCETDDINNQGFDISSDFLNKGAVIVITNFTKILGDQAAMIVMRLVDLLKIHADDAVQLGEIMLKLRQQLLAEGLVAVLSLMTYGDADWKIKST